MLTGPHLSQRLEFDSELEVVQHTHTEGSAEVSGDEEDSWRLEEQELEEAGAHWQIYYRSSGS